MVSGGTTGHTEKMELTLKPTVMGKEERAKKSQQLSKTLENALKAAVDRSSREARKDQDATRQCSHEQTTPICCYH